MALLAAAAVGGCCGAGKKELTEEELEKLTPEEWAARCEKYADLTACHWAAGAYYRGEGVEPDEGRALDMNTVLCDHDDGYGCFVVGTAMVMGMVPGASEDDGWANIHKACALGHEKACSFPDEIAAAEANELVQTAEANGELASARLIKLLDPNVPDEKVYRGTSVDLDAAADEFERHDLQHGGGDLRQRRLAEIDAIAGKPWLVTLQLNQWPWGKNTYAEYDFDRAAWPYTSAEATWNVTGDATVGRAFYSHGTDAVWLSSWSFNIHDDGMFAYLRIDSDKTEGWWGRNDHGHAVLLWPMPDEEARERKDEMRYFHVVQMAVIPDDEVTNQGPSAPNPNRRIITVEPVAYRLCKVTENEKDIMWHQRRVPDQEVFDCLDWWFVGVYR